MGPWLATSSDSVLDITDKKPRRKNSVKDQKHDNSWWKHLQMMNPRVKRNFYRKYPCCNQESCLFKKKCRACCWVDQKSVWCRSSFADESIIKLQQKGRGWNAFHDSAMMEEIEGWFRAPCMAGTSLQAFLCDVLFWQYMTCQCIFVNYTESACWWFKPYDFDFMSLIL